MAKRRTGVFSMDIDREYPMIVSGNVNSLYDTEGNEYIDAAGGPIMVNMGYGNQYIIDAIKKQYDEIPFVYRVYSQTPILLEASEMFREFAENDFDKMTFCAGGSEATELAMKAARTYHVDNGEGRREKIISRWMSYHGNTNGALSVSGSLMRRKMFEHNLVHDPHIAPAYCYRCWFGKTEGHCNLECAQALEEAIRMGGPETVSAFIAEPISGSTLSAAVPPEGYFPKIREICDRYGVLLILDEVMTGIGRTGEKFAYKHFGIKPDIIAMGKGLGGGYFPIGGIALSEKIIDAMLKGMGFFPSGHSWLGNPLASAACKATLEYIEQNDLIGRSAARGVYFKERLREVILPHPTVGDIRGLGLMVGVEFVKDKGTKEVLDPALHFYAQLQNEATAQYMFIQTSGGADRGIGGDQILFGPAFTSTEKDIDRIVERFDSALAVCEKRIGY
jgi:adenosylmethionine-8-amino-7-oxononanoate aminotransferase